MKTNMDADTLRAILYYSPESGAFTRLVSTSNSAKVGEAAGSKTKNGYTEMSVLGRRYYAHRLAWLHMHGSWPKGQIDHIDGNRSNNGIANLRDVTCAVNVQNKKIAQSNSTHGFLGAKRSGKRWSARIHVNGQQHHIGCYDTPEEAHAAYISEKRRLHPGCTI